jgi:DNA-directed RNA polymerase specialized sigma24 family protein
MKRISAGRRVMKAAVEKSRSTRELLHRAILRVLRSWPERERVVFRQVHYCGRSAEDVSSKLGLEPGEVHEILRSCDFKLRASLREFRERSLDSPDWVAGDNLEVVSY